MIRNVQRRWFEIWGTEAAQNYFLKGLVAFLLVLLAVQVVGLTLLARRRPEFIATNGLNSCLVTTSPPTPELLNAERRRGAETYATRRYNWQWQEAEKAVKSVAPMIAKSYQKDFSDVTTEQLKTIADKHISQRFHVLGVTFPGSGIAMVRGDRILMIDGLMAVSTVSFELTLEDGTRTPENPGGIYVTADKLILEKPGS